MRCGAVRRSAHGRGPALLPVLLPAERARLAVLSRTARLSWKSGSGEFPTEFGDQMYLEEREKKKVNQEILIRLTAFLDYAVRG